MRLDTSSLYVRLTLAVFPVMKLLTSPTDLVDLTFTRLQKIAPLWSQRIRQRRIVLSIASFGIETDIFTPYIVHFATKWRKLVHFWFMIGAVVGVGCLVVTMIYLLPSYLWARFMTSQPPSVEVQLIVRAIRGLKLTFFPVSNFLSILPQIPGVTLPWTFVPHVMIAIFLTLAFHELGHALSGANDNKAIESIGLVIQLFIPTAYVRFREHHYDLTPWRQLKVYCAGAWHNFVLYGLAALILSNSILVVSPLYTTSTDGQTVTRIKFYESSSPLRVGDRIVGLNHFSVSTLADWSTALHLLSEASNSTLETSACVPQAWISIDNSKELECCSEAYNGPIPCWKEVNTNVRFCRPAREVWAQGVKYCSSDELHADCRSDSSMACAVPLIQERYAKHGIKLLQIRVVRNEEKLLLHSLQHPYELLHQLEFETFVPRWSWLPGFTKHWADHFITLCSLLANFNLITPIISLLPIYAFDGEYALYAITMWLAPELDDDIREKIIAWIRNATSAVGALILLLSAIKTFF